MKILFSFLVILCLTGCMSDKEYQLRKHQLENQSKHQQTYSPLTLQGPASFNLQAGSKLEVKSPTQPFKEVYIPDGMKYQTDVTKHAINVGAMGVIGYKALKEANGETTVINNAKEAGK